MAMDRISDLPDHLIHHVLSLLPSIKQIIQIGILSKRWRKQWTQVPALIFNSTGMSNENFINLIEKSLTLHESSKINTFHLLYDFDLSYEKDPNFDEKIRFATTKKVEDLSISFRGYRGECFLPEFLFKATSLVKLRIRRFYFNLINKVNWPSLKALNIVACNFLDQAMEQVLSGSPLLELLELSNFAGMGRDMYWFREKFHKLPIASRSLKILVLDKLCFDVLEISCPNLEELSLKRSGTDDPKQIGEAIKNVLSNCLLLESLMVSYNYHRLHLPVIASQSLKRLVICNMEKGGDCFELSCPKLEELTLLGFIDIMNVNFGNLPSFLCATLDFETPLSTHETRNSLKDILQQFKYIKELRVGKFVFELSEDMADLDGFIEDFWSSNHCLLSHLKRIKIYAILRKNKKPTRILNFIQFLLNNARVLENMTVVLTKPYHEQYWLEVSQKLFGFTRWSNHATVELIPDECS